MRGNVKSRVLGLAFFILHQIIGTWGLAIAARRLTDLFLAVLRLCGVPAYAGHAYQLLTGAPFFPTQILLGFAVGWLLSRLLRHRSMTWVWVLPLAFLCYAFIALPTLTPNATPYEFQAGRGQSRLTHYFGTGCRIEDLCFDQALITLSFYIAAAYSAGARLAQGSLTRRQSESARTVSPG